MISRASPGVGGVEGNNYSVNESISEDGRFIAFESSATNLAPSDPNGPLSDVFIYDREDGSLRLRSVTDQGFAPSVNGDGSVIAFWSPAILVGNDANGEQDVFVSLVGEPPLTIPDPPTGLTATPGDGRVTVGWIPPANDGGSPTTGYEVVVSPGGIIVPVDPGATQKVITGLTNCTDYTFIVRALNAVGTGRNSAPSTAVTPSTTTTVQVGENGTVTSGQVVYTPLRITVPVDQCVRVEWTFKNTNIRTHTVTESSASAGVGLASGGAGLALFDSGPVAAGGSFGPYLFRGATFYQYRSRAAGDSNSPSLYGSVTMPVVVSPASGSIGSAFTVKWAPTPMPGYSFTIQYQFRKAGKNWPSTWTAWLANQTGNTAAFTPIPRNGPGDVSLPGEDQEHRDRETGGLVVVGSVWDGLPLRDDCHLASDAEVPRSRGRLQSSLCVDLTKPGSAATVQGRCATG